MAHHHRDCVPVSPRGTDGTGRCWALDVHFLGNASSLGPKSTGVQMGPNQNQDGTGTPLSSSTGSFYPNDSSPDGLTFPKVPPPKADRRLKAHILTGGMTEGPPAAPPRPTCTRSWRMWAPDTRIHRTSATGQPAPHTQPQTRQGKVCCCGALRPHLQEQAAGAGYRSR